MEIVDDEPKNQEERAAAEDFRRQLQERSAEGCKLVTREERMLWLDENREVFAEVANASWGPTNKPSMTFADFKEELQRTPLPSPHDDPVVQSLMRMLCEEVENACHSLGVPLHSGVAYGSIPVLEISAEQRGVPLTDASVISLTSGFITFCSHISKAFSLSLPQEGNGDMLRVSFDPNLVLARIGADKELKQYWARVIGAYAFGSGPLDVKHQLVPYPASITRIQLLLAMERFSAAHEYAHHIARHGRREFAEAGKDPGAINQEFEADRLALSLERHIGYRHTPSNIFSASGTAAVLFLKCHHSVRRVRQIFLTGDDTIKQGSTHPEISERIAAFDSLDEQVPERNRQDFRKMRRDFAAIVDEVYDRLRPLYVEMYRQGQRPLGESWLPV